MRKKSIEPLISALSVFNITKAGRQHRRELIEDEFVYMSPFGEPFEFVLIHDGTAEWFAKDFRVLLSTMAFKNTKYELDIERTLKEASKTIESIVKGESNE